jgi:NADPH:quinone reductase-like Zn-dependent oxidoreductase
MRAVALEQTGPAENLQLKELPLPTVDSGSVLLRVRACSVAYRDVVDRSGRLPFMKLPVILGHEFAGEVVAVGADVTRWKVGDRVVNLHRNFCGACAHCTEGDERRCMSNMEAFGVTVDGGYAEYCRAGERALEALPDSISYTDAASVMGAMAVAYENLVEVAGVGPSSTVLITGASGGVGSNAVQIAHSMGCTVYAVTRNADKVPFLEKLGADHVIVASDGRFHKAVMAKTGGAGVDASLDCVGTPTLNSSLRSLRPGGSVVVIGNIDGQPFSMNPGLVILKSLRILGSAGVSRDSLVTVLGRVAQGDWSPQIDRIGGLVDIIGFHGLLEAGGACGRLVVRPA